MGAGPVDLRPESGEDLVPVDWAAAGKGLPEGQLRGISEERLHVVARVEAEQLQRGF